MEALSKLRYRQQPLQLSPDHRSPSFSIPNFSIKLPSPMRLLSSTKLPPIRASSSFDHSSRHSEVPRPPFFETLKPLIRTSCVAIATAVLFLSRYGGRSPALAAPPAAVESKDGLSMQDKEKSLEEYLESHPDEVDALRSLMEVKIKTGKLDDAILILDRLIALVPDDRELPLLKAHTQIYNGDSESAKSGFEDVLSKDPLAVEAYHGLVMAVSLSGSGDLKGVMARVEEAMERCKKEKKDRVRDFKLLIAQVRVIEGSYGDALKVYQQLVKEEPRDFRPYLCQGIIYTLLKKKDEADKQFEKYRRLVPKGHPYAEFFDESMFATKIFSQASENRAAGLQS